MDTNVTDKIIGALDKADAFIDTNLKNLAKEYVKYKTVNYAGPLILELRNILSDVTTSHQVSLADSMISMACVRVISKAQ